MRTYALNRAGRDPLYLQLSLAIKKEILEGSLPARAKMPSKRRLAGHLGVSVITVENAYERLKAEGFLLSHPRRGYFVAPLPNLQDRNAERNKLPQKKDPSRPPKASRYRYDLTGRSPSPRLFPFSNWTKTVRRVLSSSREDLLHRQDSQGLWSLRKSLSDFLLSYRGMSVDPSRLLIGAGSEYLYGLLALLLGKDCPIYLEDPGYPKLHRVYSCYGLTLHHLPLEEGGMPVPKNAPCKAVVHLTPSHQYPTGRILPIARRLALLNWAREGRDRYLIEDDYDSELPLSGYPLPSLYSLDRNRRVIYLNTFSQTLLGGVRVSYLVLPPRLMTRFQKDFSFFSSTVSPLEQESLARFIREGHFESHLHRLRHDIRKKRDAFLNAVAASSLKEKVHLLDVEAGNHFLMILKSPLGEAALVEAAKKKGILLDPLRNYARTSLMKTAIPPRCFLVTLRSLEGEQFSALCSRLAALC